jgi:hypothetical protein
MHRGVGFAVSTSSRRCVGSFAQDTADPSNCGTVARNDAVMCTTDGAAGSDGEVDLDVINSDGFRLIVDDQLPQSVTIFWEAWGGSDITVAEVGDISEPAAGGDVDYTVTGFVSGATDQVVMLAGVQSVAAVNTAEAEASGMYIGYATGASGENIIVGGNADDSSATMDTDGWALAGECVGMVAKAGAATVEARASLTQFGTDNFRLNWAARNVTSRRSIFLAIKGGGWRVGETTIEMQTLNATTTISGLPFAPIGMSLISRGKAEQASNVTTGDDHMGWGCGSSTSSRRSMSVEDENAAAACEIDLAIEYDGALCRVGNNGTINSVVDIDAMNSDGFRLIVDLAGGVTATWIGYLAFGDAPLASLSASGWYGTMAGW